MEGLIGSLMAVLPVGCLAAEADVPEYLRRYKLPEPVLRPTHRAGDFDSEMVDCPQVLRWGDRWLMQYTASTGSATASASRRART